MGAAKSLKALRRMNLSLPKTGKSSSALLRAGERGDSWHTFHVIIFHIFSVLAKLNVRVRMASITFGLQSYVHKFDGIRKE
jgi:nitrate reductase NapE component